MTFRPSNIFAAFGSFACKEVNNLTWPALAFEAFFILNNFQGNSFLGHPRAT